MINLNTNAEKLALEATKLPDFRDVALPGIKDKVAEMLGMIGSVEQIFATYTKHDIGHVNAMLQYLDWLIPPSTQATMTCVDWLLITMAIFLHDLGMVVASAEYDDRKKNEAFLGFLERIETDTTSKEYLSRTNRMTPEQRDVFLFQEFIRETHPNRIREWITGRPSRYWGSAVKSITEAVSSLMKPFPSRFRENLALVCESHHRDDLNKLDLYPLCQKYGSDDKEMANVQYAALILRTVDLLHVTKDRTPSVMYKIIKFSDPKGVDEWDKQKSTFVVSHVGRTFDPSDENTHVIMVGADFTEERPFFALTEYLAWADAEIKQTKRWSDQARLHSDGRGFLFPWKEIRGDLRVEGNQPQQMRFEFDRGRLLDLLVGHAVYNDPTVAIRELLQNAIDAVRFQRYLDLDGKLQETEDQVSPPTGVVAVTWNNKTREFSVQDNGIGMDLDTIKFHLMRVGSSFYDTAQFAAEHKGFTPISRFGIGILTCFMISDDVEIVTVKKEGGHRIRMSSVHADYLLRELPLGDAKLAGIEPHGTKVTLIIRDSIDLAHRSIDDILRHWIVLPKCRVDYTESGRPTVQIGFSSPTQALEHFYKESQDEQGQTWEDIQVKKMHRALGGGQCEMALAVQTGWYPEKVFAHPPKVGLPAVCIEGIRVANYLPGFGGLGENAVSALVSVRGIRGLRTTVSRSGLEQDEEYRNLERACVEMLVEHIQEEISRISNEQGKPLSQASTGGKWLSTDLVKTIVSETGRDYFWMLRKKLPLIVVERGTGQNVNSVERTLVSPEGLEKEDFWTIESRVVNSLGILSRDLSRELSLNKFLTLLAPEYAYLGHLPMLPDADLFQSDILSSHHPNVVEFSHSHQQTAIMWVPGSSSYSQIYRAALADRDFVAAVNQALRAQAAKNWHVNQPSEPCIAIAEIKGDQLNVTVVLTRIAIVLRPHSEPARIWELLERGITLSSHKKQAQQFVTLLEISTLFQLLLQRNDFWQRNNYIDPTRPDANRLWEILTIEANRTLMESGDKERIPESFDFIAKRDIFDAADHWRDWYRKG